MAWWMWVLTALAFFTFALLVVALWVGPFLERLGDKYPRPPGQ